VAAVAPAVLDWSLVLLVVDDVDDEDDVSDEGDVLVEPATVVAVVAVVPVVAVVWLVAPDEPVPPLAAAMQAVRRTIPAALVAPAKRRARRAG
jgi:hypothetical protein